MRISALHHLMSIGGIGLQQSFPISSEEEEEGIELVD